MPPKSKPGEGIVVIVDVSPGVRASTENTFYSQAKSCLIHILQRKIFADKCKDMVGVVLMGTDETKNKLESEDQYQHITVFQEPKFVDWGFISSCEQLTRGSSQGDWLDAIVVAMDLLHDPDDIFFSTKKIVLMTDFSSDFTDDQTQTIIKGMKTMEIEFTVIGPSLEDEDEDDEESGNPSTSNQNPSKNKSRKKSAALNWNGKPKSRRQLAAECLVKGIVSEVDGIICSFDEAIPQLIFFEKKSQGSANWNAMMDIGPNFKIPVVGRIKVKRATPSSWKRTYIGDENAMVVTETSHHLKDENHTVVESEDIISGYKYGTTLVPFGEEDAKLKYVCESSGAMISVLGFTKASNVPLTLRAGDQVLVVTAKDGDEDGAVAFSSIIQALKELDMVAITRRIYRKNMNPTLGALYPDITTDYECLIWVGLPFQEDICKFTFPSLEKSTQKLTKEQDDIIDQLITDMDLSANGEEDEELDPNVIVNPQLQHYYNCLTYRALKPSEPLPGPQQHILELLEPPPRQREARDKLMDKLKQQFPTKKIENYKQKKADLFANANDEKPSDLSTSKKATTLTSDDLTRVAVHKISTATPAEDFIAMLHGDQPIYTNICEQMQDVLLQMAESLSGDTSSDQILEAKLSKAMKTFREEALIMDPSPYNGFIKQLKQIVKGRGFDSLWRVIREEKLGLITSSNTLKSKVTSEEAEKFFQVEEQVQEAPTEVQDEGDYDDMLDDL